MGESSCILFTAFEPSGDEHAAPVIGHLRRLRPDVPVYAMGGPRMAEAGADLIERTTERSVMLAGAAGQAWTHRRRLSRLRKWLRDHPVAVHVPTDSPAANWSICRLVKVSGRQGSDTPRVVHLVAPQLWAWGTWRVRRLRRLTDRVLCLLPFEPAWFEKRDVPATFVGHPLFDRPIDPPPDEEAGSLPEGTPKLAILPGSRPAEVRRNLPLMLRARRALAGRYPDLATAVAAGDSTGAARIRERLDATDDRVAVTETHTDTTIRWADAVLTVSGTVTLRVARHQTPMVIVYRVNPLAWHLIGRWLMATGTFTLPNLIANGGPTRDRSRHVVPELVPCGGGTKTTHHAIQALVALLDDSNRRKQQVDALRAIARPFATRNAGREAATAIAEML